MASFSHPLIGAALLSAAMLGGGAAHAAIIEAPLPSNAYISFGGLDWAWASPLPAISGWGSFYDIDLGFQSAFGWRLPTMAELMMAPAAVAFMFPGANVPLGGTDPVSGATFFVVTDSLTGAAACATPYFSNAFLHCDWQDGLGEVYGPWAGMPGAESFAEQLVVRGASIPPVPVPASLGLMGLALGALTALGLRRRARRSAA